MKDLTLTGTDDGALILEDDGGTRYRLAVDDAVRSAVRRAPLEEASERRLSPREIQAHIRAGMSAKDVVAISGASLEYIERFEGPVLAEREHIVDSALAVPMRLAAETDPDEEPRTFGTVITERLREFDAQDERWSSWKDPAEGWIVKLSFAADGVEHDARWSFDARTSALVPINNDAITLSQQGELPGPLIPRLRAVGDAGPGEDGRFDSGAFRDQDLGMADTMPHPGPSVVELPRPADAREADADHAPSHQTADLLEALRRRRGERESAHYDDDAMAEHPSTGSIRVIDVPLDEPEPEPQPQVEPEPEPAMTPSPPAPRSSRRGRPVMPSWDEIVFGARPDDDPA